MSQAIAVALLGFEGEAAEAILDALSEWPGLTLHVLAEGAETGEETVLFRQRPLPVENAETFDFSKVAVLLVLEADRPLIEQALKQNVRVLLIQDAVSDWPAPVVLPAQTLPQERCLRLAAPELWQLSAVLKPLQALGLTRASVVSLEPASAVGSDGVKVLAHEFSELLNGRPSEPGLFPAQLAFNLIPMEESANRALYSSVTQSLGASLIVELSRVRVPVFYGLSQQFHLQFAGPVTPEAVVSALEAAGIAISTSLAEAGPAGVVQEEAGIKAVCGALANGEADSVVLWAVADNIRTAIAKNVTGLLQNWLKAL